MGLHSRASQVAVEPPTDRAVPKWTNDIATVGVWGSVVGMKVLDIQCRWVSRC